MEARVTDKLKSTGEFKSYGTLFPRIKKEDLEKEIDTLIKDLERSEKEYIKNVGCFFESKEIISAVLSSFSEMTFGLIDYVKPTSIYTWPFGLNEGRLTRVINYIVVDPQLKEDFKKDFAQRRLLRYLGEELRRLKGEPKSELGATSALG